MNGPKVLLITGSACVVVGLGLTIFQMFFALPAPGEMHFARVNPATLSLETHFPGIIVIAIGAVLLIAGSFVGRRSN
jgi:hypothetical protein